MDKTHLIPILAVIVAAVFLTNSAYAYTTKFTGTASCSYYTGCYYTLTTSNGTGRVFNTFMNATHTVTGVALYGSTTRHLVAEHVNTTSVLVGKNINVIKVKLQGLGAPPGFFQVGVFDVNQNVKRLFANVSASTLVTTGYRVYTFTTGSNYTIAPDDYIGVFYNTTGSDSTNNISVMRDNYTGFDGANSQYQYYDTKWKQDVKWDVYMLLQNVGVQKPAWVRTNYGGYAVMFQLPGESNVTQTNTGYFTSSSTVIPSTYGTSYLIKGNFSVTDVNTGKIVNGSTSKVLNISGHSGRGGGIIYRYLGGSITVLETPQLSHYTTTTTYCNPSSTALGNYTTCYANVTNVAKQYTKTPTGTVSFSLTAGIGSFSPPTCTLFHDSCHVRFNASLENPGTSQVIASYLGDSGHLPSTGTTELYVTGTPVDGP